MIHTCRLVQHKDCNRWIHIDYGERGLSSELACLCPRYYEEGYELTLSKPFDNMLWMARVDYPVRDAYRNVDIVFNTPQEAIVYLESLLREVEKSLHCLLESPLPVIQSVD